MHFWLLTIIIFFIDFAINLLNININNQLSKFQFNKVMIDYQNESRGTYQLKPFRKTSIFYTETLQKIDNKFLCNHAINQKTLFLRTQIFAKMALSLDQTQFNLYLQNSWSLILKQQNQCNKMMFTTRKSFQAKYQSQHQFNSTFSTPIKNKMMGSTATSGAFPRISMSAQSSRSSSASSFRNTKGKLETLQSSLSGIMDQIQCLRQQTKETRQYKQFISEDLIERRLPQIQANLIQQVRKLSKQMKVAEVSSISRMDAIKQDANQLKQSSKDIKMMLNELAKRLNGIQHVMGFYSGCEKHKY